MSPALEEIWVLAEPLCVPLKGVYPCGAGTEMARKQGGLAWKTSQAKLASRVQA